MSGDQQGNTQESERSGDDLLVCSGVTKRFPGVRALSEVDVTVREGEVHALVGQNGAGKSTLVKCITGVYTPDAGEMSFAGERITTFSPKNAADIGIAVVHQRTPMHLDLSVAENVHLGHLPTRMGLFDRNAASRRTRELLDRFKLDVDPEVPVASLSVSARQEVAIARALFRDARLLVLDEPTAALDAAQAKRLFAVVDNLRRQNVAVIYVSHYLEEIFALADRITVLRDGRLVRTAPTAELTHEEVVTLMAGHRPDNAFATRKPVAMADDADAAVVRLDNVSTEVVHDVKLSVAAGEVIGITGVIGAGGHEIARLLYGLTRPTEGTVTVAGRPFASRGPRDSLSQGICLVPEDSAREGMVGLMSVAGNISLVDLKAFSRLGWLSHGRERREARRFVKELGIATSTVDAPVQTLSGGNQQKVLIARALTAKAEVLVLEEPTQGVDVHAKAEIHKVIRNLAAGGKVVIVISTDVQDLLLFVDRIVGMRRGRVALDTPAHETSFADILDVTVGTVGIAA